MCNVMANHILGHVQTLPILSGARSSTSDCSGDNPRLHAQEKVVSNQLQVSYIESLSFFGMTYDKTYE